MWKKEDKNPDVQYFTVYDSKAQSYREPIPAPNKEVLMRDFLNAFRRAATETDTKNVYYLNAEDYSLFKIGEFDFKTGHLAGIKMEHVANLHDIRAMAQPSQTGGH